MLADNLQLGGNATTFIVRGRTNVIGFSVDGSGNGYLFGNYGIGSTTPAAKLGVTGLAGGTIPLFLVASSTNVPMFKIARTGLQSTGGEAPTVATSTGAGTGVATLVGVQNGGSITLVTGAAPSTSAVVMTVTLKEACPTAIVPVIYPANATTAALSGTSMVFATGTSATTWTINSNTVALVGATTYQWNYQIICR